MNGSIHISRILDKTIIAVLRHQCKSLFIFFSPFFLKGKTAEIAGVAMSLSALQKDQVPCIFLLVIDFRFF